MESNYFTLLLWFLPYIDMNQPWVYMCPPSWTSLPPASPSHPSGSSQCTSPEHPLSCIEPGPVICFTYGNIHVSMLFSQIIPPFSSPTRFKSLFFKFCLFCYLPYRVVITIFLNSIYMHSVQFSHSVVSDSLWPHESQHARPPCPSGTPGVHSDSRPSSQWCHPAISFSVVPFSSCPQSLQASESFPMSQLFAWGGQSTGVSALASFLPKKSQGWSPSEWTGWISLQSKGLSRVFSKRGQLEGLISLPINQLSQSHCVFLLLHWVFPVSGFLPDESVHRRGVANLGSYEWCAKN